MYTLQINVDYEGGCTASDRISFNYQGKIKPFTPIPEPSVKWKHYTGSHTHFSTICDNFIYFGCGNGDVYCLDAYTGDFQWKYTIDDNIETKPLVVNSKVYVGSDHGKMYCFNADNGDVLWIYPTFDYIHSSPKYWNGCLYFDSGNKLYCIDAENGDFKWNFSTGGKIYMDPTIYNGKVYVESQKDHLYCIDAITGEEIWRLKSIFGTSPVADNGKIYFGSDRFLFCLNSSNGEFIWSYETGTRVSTPAVVNGCVYFTGLTYFCGEYVMLYCVDADDAKLIWSYKLAPDVKFRSYDPVSVSNGRVYGCYGVDYVYCHDAKTGELRWRFNNPSSSTLSPTSFDGMVYVDLWDKNLYCLIYP